MNVQAITPHGRGAYRALIVADILVAATAVAGALAFVPGWVNAGNPLDPLYGMPLGNYVILYLILAIIVGGGAAATVATMLIRRSPRIGATASAVIGAMMMGWITGDVLIPNQPPARFWVEAICFAVGLMLVGLGWAVRRAERETALTPKSA